MEDHNIEENWDNQYKKPIPKNVWDFHFPIWSEETEITEEFQQTIEGQLQEENEGWLIRQHSFAGLKIDKL